MPSFEEFLLWEKGNKGRSGFSFPANDTGDFDIDPDLIGEIPDLTELSEPDVVRHYTRLSQWNFCVDLDMYPLGSCTMKYNPRLNERQAQLKGFTEAHPLLPARYLQGILKLMYDLEAFLREITGMEAVSLQPSAGAQGELTGIMLIDACLRSRGEKRTKFIVPDTAHGTNPASITLCGFVPVNIKSNEKGILSPESVASVMDEDVAGIMMTNPNTLGLYEENIARIAEIIHSKGGMVYCDGANLNALMGIVQMGSLGVDVMHVNLHKTFSSPHGGGGPGSGPVCVKKHLEPFLPVPRIIESDRQYELIYDCPDTIGKIHSFYGNIGVMIRAYCYILSMGPEFLKKASQLAVLNANYIKESLKDVFHLPYDRTCMHECVFTDEKQQHQKVTALDVAKRLIDYGFHPPTVYFPLVVKGALMIEPTETESKETLDRFIEACRQIAREAEENPELLHNAPSQHFRKRIDETFAARNLYLRD
ncbi:MAG: aminomethyl-transferring glycine dehydrogenase subunit GcvPB [Candidatus Latescibacteria bacterium]|nr:aminomethyl-transferring glycine dehydrogenase subunit GcvPB [Candidatus Latescibacterota bacterium]